MSTFRSRGQRRHRLRLPVHRYDTESAGWIFIPDPLDGGDDLSLPSFGHAARLAVDLVESGLITSEGLILLDERRRMVAVLCDVPGELGLLAGTVEFVGVAPYCQVIDVVVRAEIVEGPAGADDRSKFEALSQHMRRQGLLLLDVILTNADKVQSLSIACDPQSVWFDPFEPIRTSSG